MPNFASPQRFDHFLLVIFLPYMNKQECIVLPPDLVREIYPLMVHTALGRTHEQVSRLHSITEVLPMLDGTEVATKDYAQKKSTELRTKVRGSS